MSAADQPFEVVPASYLLLRRGEQVLLQLRQNTGYADGHWGVGAAGHVERGESAFEAAAREAAEELGVRVDPADLRPLCSLHRTGRGEPIDERVDFFFETLRWQGEPRIAEPDKAADLSWFDLEALPEPVVPHELAVLEAYREGALPAVLTFGFPQDLPAQSPTEEPLPVEAERRE